MPIVSDEATSWALGQPVSHARKLVLIGVATYADRDGRNAWPSLADLALYASVSRRTVSRVLAWLERSGYLVREVQQGGTRDTLDWRRPNLYHLRMGGHQ